MKAAFVAALAAASLFASAASAEDIRQMTRHVGTQITSAESLQLAMDFARQGNRPVVVTGSVYLVGAALELLARP